MLGCALAFILLPLYASFHKHENNAWKSRAFATSWLYLVVLFFLQGVDAPFIGDIQVRTLLGRVGILAVGFSGCVLAFNGLNNHWIAGAIQSLQGLRIRRAGSADSEHDRKAVE